MSSDVQSIIIMAGSIAASRQTSLEELRVLHLVLETNRRRLASRQLGEKSQNSPPQGLSSSNKTIPTSTRPYLLIVPFPGPGIFKTPQVLKMTRFFLYHSLKESSLVFLLAFHWVGLLGHQMVPRGSVFNCRHAEG